MPKYQYTAANRQGKSLFGVIEADNINEARVKLNSLKLSIVSINQIADDDGNQQINFLKFKFEAADKDGKKVIGTIASKSILEAYNKLITEYELKVFKIASITASKLEFDESVQKVNELEKLQSSLNKNIENDNSGQEYIDKLKDKEYLDLIEEVIETIRKVKTQFAEDLRPDALEFLIKYEEHLEKIKHSENLDNVIDAALKVLKHLEEAKLYITEKKFADEKLDLQLQVIGLSKELRQQGDQADSLKQKIHQALSKIGIRKPKENLKVKEKSKYSTILNYLKIIFVSKSNQLRATALKNFIPELKKIFNDKSNQNLQNEKFKKELSHVEMELLKLSYYLCGIYLIYYFIATFLSIKIANSNISSIFFLFNTKLIIYIIIAIILFHSSIKLRKLMLEHKIHHSKIIYSLLSVLFAIIIINL